LVRTLDGRISDLVVGGGGRYLLLAMRDRKQLAIFDVNVADVVKRIPLPSQDTLIAAGAEKFVLISPGRKRIERWALATLVRETERPSPIDGQVTAIAMGCDSAGPILASWAGGEPGPTPSGAFSFIDLGTLKVLRNLAFNQTSGNQVQARPAASGVLPVLQITSGQNCGIRASADGRTFGLWRTDTAPQGFLTFTIRGKQVEGIYVQKDVGHVVPSPDGQVVFTGTGGVLGLDAKPAVFRGPTTPPTFTIPSTDQRYYLGVGVSATPKNESLPRDVTVFDAEGSALASVGGLDEMSVPAGPPNAFLRDPWFDKRYHFVPAADLLITVPPTNDRLVVRRLSLKNVARTDRSIKKP
jgi:hypothetical protein